MAKKDNNDFFRDLKSDIKQYGDTVAKYSAKECSEELSRSAYNAILAFYNDYQPIVYRRHMRRGKHYNLGQNSFTKVFEKSSKDVYTGGIILSPDGMEDIYRTVNWQGHRVKDIVFDIVYQGFHGLDGWTQFDVRPAEPYAITSPSPSEIILKKADGIAKSPAPYIHKAIIIANSKDYKVI